VIGHVLQSKNVFVMSGYIPENVSQTLADELNQKFQLAVEFEIPSEEEEVPVCLKNNSFSAPLEWIVNAYSPPENS
jgi:V/A-type H+-transporting ATPase subunit I